MKINIELVTYSEQSKHTQAHTPPREHAVNPSIASAPTPSSPGGPMLPSRLLGANLGISGMFERGVMELRENELEAAQAAPPGTQMEQLQDQSQGSRCPVQTSGHTSTTPSLGACSQNRLRGGSKERGKDIPKCL